MWAISNERTIVIKQAASPPPQKRHGRPARPVFTSLLMHGQTFTHRGNQSLVTRVDDDKDLTLLAETCANILREYEDYMARQNGRGSSRPRVLTRTARPKSPFSVSVRNCSSSYLRVISLLSVLLVVGAFAFAQDSDVDNIHVSPRIEPTNIDPAAAIVSQSL